MSSCTRVDKRSKMVCFWPIVCNNDDTHINNNKRNKTTTSVVRWYSLMPSLKSLKIVYFCPKLLLNSGMTAGPGVVLRENASENSLVRN